METLKQVLMRRDELDSAVADELIQIAKDRVSEGEDPERVLEEEFGLEPDWVMELL